LTEDLIERLIIDLLEVTESLQGGLFPDTLFTPFRAQVTNLDVTGADGTMMTLTSGTASHQPDREHGRPDESNFGDADQPGGQRQSGFSRQC
jgi:glutamate decarboxylase